MLDPGPLHSGPLSIPIALVIQSNLERKNTLTSWATSVTDHLVSALYARLLLDIRGFDVNKVTGCHHG